MKKTLFLLIIIPLFVISSCGQKKEKSSSLSKEDVPSIAQGQYDVNLTESKLEWIGKQLSAKEHRGTLNIKKGQISIDDSGVINGGIEIDMLSINTTDIKGRGKDRLDGHLKSPDFFDVEKHPVAFLKFKSDSKDYLDGQLKFVGELTIKNITHPISFQSKINSINGKLSANAKVAFDRSLYDVRYGSGKFFDNLGDRLIYDEINIDVLIITI
ncbi:MAG: lipid-binding protein [Candidatus Marinimicrobia bacterium]|nr:lipid-binding protein [Candidatus Neomarinimicrobiota bacterium]